LISYLDTSALIKSYVREDNSEEVVRLLGDIEGVGTSVITYAEMASAMARGARMGAFSPDDARAAWEDFLADWSGITRLKVAQGVLERAAAVAWEHGLRGYDAMHLASALAWQETIETPVALATFDRELWLAAQRGGLEAWPEELGGK
jgi:predicted nucleic acid-binding protein